ncbi:hypothetical protein [Sandarakinorhabdus sp.]|jgi:hypothetical protein|uniref:hypothetical protein n=1 Tax=Sandarakinorhabdus sp. TaxID=1916663 RepID=UPI0028AE62A7|nr:hypothetical protein [Sandarakinorhabdus sp.]
MSLPLPALLTALANAQGQEVAPALQLLGQPGAPDANYASGTAATSALILMIAAAEAAARPAREVACVDAARLLVGAAADDRDTRAAALGTLLAAGNKQALALLKAEAAAEWQVLAGLMLPPPVPVE